jgi:ribose 5-phosphate isomerase B
MENDIKTRSGIQIAIASDHAGFGLKQDLITRIQQNVTTMGAYVIDKGPVNDKRVDYPDYAALVTAAVLGKHVDLGILICGSGIGMSMMANRYSGIRCALVSDPLSAQLSRQHNDSNVLALGARLIGPDQAWACVQTWLQTEFEGGRHKARINKLDTLFTP